jgi:hypothetical protein
MEYQGQILDGQMHGRGKLIYENNEYYAGEWVRGRDFIFILGISAWTVCQAMLMLFPQASVTAGESTSMRMVQSLKVSTSATSEHGCQRNFISNFVFHSGQWENDRINGEGTSWYPNGNRFVGSWVNGKINGIGKYSPVSKTITRSRC